MPREQHPTVYYHGRDKLECGQHTATLSIRGQRYAYYLTSSQADTVEFLCHRGLARRALNFAKQRAKDVAKI